jgi:hypothetical protein
MTKALRIGKQWLVNCRGMYHSDNLWRLTFRPTKATKALEEELFSHDDVVEALLCGPKLKIDRGIGEMIIVDREENEGLITWTLVHPALWTREEIEGMIKERWL